MLLAGPEQDHRMAVRLLRLAAKVPQLPCFDKLAGTVSAGSLNILFYLVCLTSGDVEFFLLMTHH
jgi:hypothetical protein